MLYYSISYLLSLQSFLFAVFQNRAGGLDMNVQEAWKLGITGKDIVVTILDDGIEKDHPDLKANYVSDMIFTVQNSHYPPGNHHASHFKICSITRS